MLKEPLEDEYFTGYKFPFISCEVLNCNVEAIMIQFFTNQKKKKLDDENFKQLKEDFSKINENNEAKNQLLESPVINNDTISSEEFEEVLEEEKETKNEEKVVNHEIITENEINNTINNTIESNGIIKNEQINDSNADSNLNQITHINESTAENIINFSQIENKEKNHTVTVNEESKFNANLNSNCSSSSDSNENLAQDDKMLDINATISIDNFDPNKYELLEQYFSFLDTDCNELNDVLAGYFQRFFTTLYTRNPLKLVKYITETSDYIFKNLLKHSNTYAITEVISMILDSGNHLEEDLEYENFMRNIYAKLFDYIISLSPQDLLNKETLYSIVAEKAMSNNKKMCIYLLRELNYLKNIVKNCFLGIDVSLISNNDYSRIFEKINHSEYCKFKKIRKNSIDILTRLLFDATTINTDEVKVGDAYLSFAPVSVSYMMKVLINAYDKREAFAWFYYDEKLKEDKKKVDEETKVEDCQSNAISNIQVNEQSPLESGSGFNKTNLPEDPLKKDEKLTEEDLELVFKVYDKTEVLNIFSMISLILFSKSKIKQNTKNTEEVLKSFDLLKSFKNSKGEDILINTNFGNFLLKVFPVFSFMFQITEEKIVGESNECYKITRTYNNTRLNPLGEEKIALMNLFAVLIKFLKFRNTFVSKIQKHIITIIDTSIVSFKI